jgi:hypothetical protein
LIPRFLHAIFERLKVRKDPTYNCEYFEVYNERIRDLLAPPHQKEGDGSRAPRTRGVHVHPNYGVVIDELHQPRINEVSEALDLINFGNQMRTVSATTMNQRSSRSHAIFRFRYESADTVDPSSDLARDNSQTSLGSAGGSASASAGPGGGQQSTVTFVDLAGHENSVTTKNRSQQYREMVSINMSLYHLSSVVAKLSEGTISKTPGKSNLSEFRNSKLTLLLAQALTGNSKTITVCTVSSLASHFNDTAQTLSFAQAVKNIKTAPQVNKSRSDVIKELEGEVRRLKQELSEAKGRGASAAEVGESNWSMQQAEYLLRTMNKQGEVGEQSRLKGTTTGSRYDAAAGRYGFSRPRASSTSMVPFLTNLSSDPALQGVINYYLSSDKIVKIGSNADVCDIIIEGIGILPEMCEVSCDANGQLSLLLIECSAGVPRVLVNGTALASGENRKLRNKDCLIFGYARSFRFIVPSETAKGSDGWYKDINLDLGSAIAEVSEEGDQFQKALPFLNSLNDRLDQSAINKFLRALHQTCPLIDEANLITQEVRSDKPVRFELHAMVDFFSLDYDKPELVVCIVWQRSKASEEHEIPGMTTRGKRTSLTGYSGPLPTDTDYPDNPLAHELAHEMGLDEDTLVGRKPTLYVWSLEKFLVRLAMIRELYEDGISLNDRFKSVQERLREYPQMDPWHECSFDSMQLLAEQAGIPVSPAITPRAETRRSQSMVEPSAGGHRLLTEDSFQPQPRLLPVSPATSPNMSSLTPRGLHAASPSDTTPSETVSPCLVLHEPVLQHHPDEPDTPRRVNGHSPTAGSELPGRALQIGEPKPAVPVRVVGPRPRAATEASSLRIRIRIPKVQDETDSSPGKPKASNAGSPVSAATPTSHGSN